MESWSGVMEWSLEWILEWNDVRIRVLVAFLEQDCGSDCTLSTSQCVHFIDSLVSLPCVAQMFQTSSEYFS